MSNIIDDYKEIEKYKNQMLENYKNLIVAYEESRELYEKIIKEYEGNIGVGEQQVVSVSKIMADNKAWVTTKWQLIGYGGELNKGLLYQSGDYKLEQTWIVDLTTLKLPEGTEMYLKASVKAGSDSTSKSTVILKYDPTSKDTAYFQLTGTAFNTTLQYKGLL